MHRFHASVLAAALFAIGVPGGVTAADQPTAGSTVTDHRHDPNVADRPPVRLRPEVVVVGASADQSAAVDEALARFRLAGLSLPDLQVVFHDHESACRGHLGLFRPQADPWEVLVCSDLAFVLTHEFAHAWEAANLDDTDREGYLELSGLSTWNSSEAEWVDRGVENAAFVVQQNLMADRPDLDSDRWLERLAAFEFLTGSESPLMRSA